MKYDKICSVKIFSILIYIYFIFIYFNKPVTYYVTIILKLEIVHNSLRFKNWCGFLMMVVDCQNMYDWIDSMYMHLREQAVGFINRKSCDKCFQAERHTMSSCCCSSDNICSCHTFLLHLSSIWDHKAGFQAVDFAY